MAGIASGLLQEPIFYGLQLGACSLSTVWNQHTSTIVFQSVPHLVSLIERYSLLVGGSVMGGSTVSPALYYTLYIIQDFIVMVLSTFRDVYL